VDAGFGAQRAVGVVAGELDGGALDTGDVAFRFFHDLYGKALFFAIFQIHAQQHRGPVLGFGTAGASLDFQEAGHRVRRVVEHAAEFKGGDLGFQFGIVGLDREQGFLVAFFLAHGKQFAAVVDAALDFFQHQHDVFQRFFLAPEFLGALGVVPDLGIFHLLVEEGQALTLLIVVKDTSAARPRAARCRRACWRCC